MPLRFREQARDPGMSQTSVRGEREMPAFGVAVRAFSRDRAGAVAIEYALIAGAIFVVIIAAVVAVGDSVGELYDTIAAAFS